MGVFGPEVDQFADSNGVAQAIAVNAAADVRTHSKKLVYGGSFALSLKAASSGVVSVIVKLEQAHVLPTTEGSSDVKWVTPEGVSNLITLSDTNWHHLTLSPVALPFLRLLLDGQAGNDASTTITAFLSKQEEF
mgnify:FL=1